MEVEEEVNPKAEIGRLGRGRSAKAIKKISKFLDDEDQYVREAALDAIWGIAAKVDALTAVGLGFGILCLDDPHRTVREKALETVGDLGGPEQLPLVARLIKDRAAFVRCSACSAVASLKGTQYLEDITACLKESEPVVRSWSATALGELGEVSAIPALQACLATETEDFCRVSIARSLVALLDKEALGPLLECLWARRLWEVQRCAEALVMLWEGGHMDAPMKFLASEKLAQRRRAPFEGDPKFAKRVKRHFGQVKRLLDGDTRVSSKSLRPWS